MFFEVKGLTKYFGGLCAVNSFDMAVNAGEIVGLIGPNGAGKSTFFNLVTGVYPLTQGKVIFDNRDITMKKPYQIAASGIARTFQLNPLFSDFTVIQNVSASFHLRPKSNLFQIFFNTATYRRNEADILEQSLAILQLVGLEKVKDEQAKNLPHGYQKMLGIARALAVSPKLLLLDEPVSGMNPSEIDFSLNSIKKMQEQGITIIVVEHNMRILDICNRVVVINFGQKICEGLPKEVRENKEVISAYLGVGNVA
jgi:branched-chain amino acid transport system ATP-binding protein